MATAVPLSAPSVSLCSVSVSFVVCGCMWRRHGSSPLAWLILLTYSACTPASHQLNSTSTPARHPLIARSLFLTLWYTLALGLSVLVSQSYFSCCALIFTYFLLAVPPGLLFICLFTCLPVCLSACQSSLASLPASLLGHARVPFPTSPAQPSTIASLPLLLISPPFSFPK